MKSLIVGILFLSMLFSGCANKVAHESPQYTCPDGRVVSDYHLCEVLTNFTDTVGGQVETNNSFPNETSEVVDSVNVACEDSDGGKAYTIRGTLIFGESEEIDSCIDEFTLREYWCNGNNISYEEIACPQDQRCVNGKCTGGSCWDSDEINQHILGTVEKGNISYADECYDENTVKEYYCEDGMIKSKNIDCDSGEECVAGVCVEKVGCTDTDGGQDKFAVGTTSYEGISHTDTCYSDAAVFEYYCDGTEVKSVTLACGLGYKCQNSKCVEEQYEEECVKEEDEFEEETVHEIMELSMPLRLYKDESVGTSNGKFLKLIGVTSEEADFALYANYEKFLSDESTCAEYIGIEMTYDLCSEREFDDEDASWDTLKFKTVDEKNYTVRNESADEDSTCHFAWEKAVEITTNEEFKYSITWLGYAASSNKRGKQMWYIPAGTISGTDCQVVSTTGPFLVFKDTDNDRFLYELPAGTDYMAVEYPQAGEQGFVTIYSPDETDSGNTELWLVENAGVWGGTDRVDAMGTQIDANFDLAEPFRSDDVADEDYTGFLVGNKNDVNGNGDIYSHGVTFDESGYKSNNRYEEKFDSMRGTQFNSGSTSAYEFKVPFMVLDSTYTTYDVNVYVDTLETDAYVEMEVDGAFVSQYSTLEGVNVDWTGLDCSEDERIYETQTLFFYPYLDSETDGEIELFGSVSFEIRDLDFEHEEFVFGEDEEIVIDGKYDSFMYDGKEYDITITVDGEGISKMVVELN